MSAVPAYGRDYKNRQQVLDDWEANKDFRIMDFELNGYINKTDLARWNSDKSNVPMVLNLRYNKETRIVQVRR